MSASQNLKVSWKNVPTRTITAGGVEFAYRELGTNNSGTPVVFLIHLAAVLDNWDPRVVDGFAASRDDVRQSRHWRVQRRTGDLDRADGHGRHHVHQGDGFRAGGPLRVFDGRDDRAGNRADGAPTRTEDDLRPDKPEVRSTRLILARLRDTRCRLSEAET
jgi:hypothetical protein